MILESEYIVDDVTITVKQTVADVTLKATQDGVSATYVVSVLTIEDTIAPVITLIGANPQTIEAGTSYTELGATTDDGSAVVIDATAVDVNTVGSYNVTYNATDAAGNAATEVIRTINVVDTTAPAAPTITDIS